MINRYKQCRDHVVDPRSSIGYVRCGLPKNWIDIHEMHYVKPEVPQPVSTRSLNPLHRHQKNVIRRYVYRRGLRLWRIFSDVDKKSVLNLAERVGLGRMIFHLKNRGILRVIVDRVECLSRNLDEQFVLLQEFRASGVRVIDGSRPRELTSSSYLNRLGLRTSAEGIKAARKALRELKWRGSLLGAKACVGRKAYGSSTLEKRVLTRILELCRTLPKDQRSRGRIRRSFKQIADALNAEKLASRTGKPWTASTVQGIIKRHRPALVRNWPEKPKQR